MSTNNFNEKIFIFLWFWNLLLFFLNLFYIILSIYKLTNSKAKFRYINNRLKTSPIYLKDEVSNFVKFYLANDIIFTIRKLSLNIEDESEILKNIFQVFKTKRDLTRGLISTNQLSPTNDNNILHPPAKISFTKEEKEKEKMVIWSFSSISRSSSSSSQGFSQQRVLLFSFIYSKF